MTSQLRENRLDSGLTFIGNATTLIRHSGFTILTDPNFLHEGERVQLGFGLNSKRLTNPAMELEDLPPLDLVLLSHLHEDHFDRRVAEMLDKQTLIVTTPGAAAGLEKLGFTNTHPLETWQSITLDKDGRTLGITAVPAQHGPSLVARIMPETMGSIIEFGQQGATEHRIYVTGDTLLFKGIDDIRQRFPQLDLAIIHLGGTQVLGVLVTMDDAQGAEMVRRLRPAHIVPVHFNDYSVFRSPLDHFLARMRSGGMAERVHHLNPGETFDFAASRQQDERRVG